MDDIDSILDQLWSFILKNEDRLFEHAHVVQTFKNKETGRQTIGFFIIYSMSFKDN